MIVSSQRDSASSVTAELFEGGFDPSPKTNAGLREVFAPAVQPSRRERDFSAWQSEGRSNVTRRGLLAAAPAALIAAAAGFRGMPPLPIKPKPPIPPAVPALTLRPIGSGMVNAYARTGTLAAARLNRLHERDEVTVDGKRYQPACLVWTDKGTSLFLRAL